MYWFFFSGAGGLFLPKTWFNMTFVNVIPPGKRIFLCWLDHRSPAMRHNFHFKAIGMIRYMSGFAWFHECDEQKSYQYQLSSSNLTSLTANVHVSKEEKIHKSTICIYPSKIEWDLSNGPLSVSCDRAMRYSGSGVRFSGSCWIFLGIIIRIYIYIIYICNTYMLDVSITWQLFFLGSVTSFLFWLNQRSGFPRIWSIFCKVMPLTRRFAIWMHFMVHHCTKNGHMVTHLMHENAWKKMHGETHGNGLWNKNPPSFHFERSIIFLNDA